MSHKLGPFPRGIVIGAVLTLAIMLVLSWAVGNAEPHEPFNWEFAAIFGTALGTTLLAVTRGGLAYLTGRDGSATSTTTGAAGPTAGAYPVGARSWNHGVRVSHEVQNGQSVLHRRPLRRHESAASAALRRRATQRIWQPGHTTRAGRRPGIEGLRRPVVLLHRALA